MRLNDSSRRRVPDRGSVLPAPNTHRLEQPDGVTFDAIQWGDAWENGWETADNYTIVRDDDGFWKYAKSERGSIAPTPNRVGIDPAPSGTPKHVRPEDGSDGPSPASSPNESPQMSAPTAGTVDFPVVMIDFPDTTPSYSPSNFQNLLFGENPSETTGPGSVADFYEESSYGQLTIDGVVDGWIEADNNHDYYADYTEARELVVEAAQKVDGQIDFSKYDNNNDGIVDQFVVIHQGAGQEATGDPNDIWSHHWSINYQTDDGVYISGYTIQPETYNGGMSTMGVYAHELGHAFGLPDLYDTDGSSEGIGMWGLMAGGSWNGVTRPGDSPAHACPWSKKYLGWTSPQVVMSGETLAGVGINDSTKHNDYYQVLEPSNTQNGEYFLVENRQRKGFDQGLPGSGVMIYHITRSLVTSSDCIYNNDCNDNEDKKLVDVEAADGDVDMDSGTNRGDVGDPWTGGRFNPASTPSSSFNDGTESGVDIGPVSIDDGVAYLSLATGDVTALDQQWSIDTGSRPQYSTPAFDTDRVFVGGLGETFYAIDRPGGAVDWSVDRSGALADSSPIVHDGTVYVGSGGGTIYALDGADGSVDWETSVGSALVSSPAVTDGSLYVGSNDGTVYALDVADGSVEWQTDAAAPVYSDVTVSGGAVYVTTNEGLVLALGTGSGSELWRFDTGIALGHSSPAVANGTVLVAADDLYALDAADGSVVWNESIGGTAGSSPTVVNGTVYVGTGSGAVEAYDVSDGSQEWTYATGGAVGSTPTVSAGRVVVGSDDGHVYLLTASTGSLIKKVAVGHPVRSSPSIVGGVVYIGHDGGSIHAFANVDR